MKFYKSNNVKNVFFGQVF